MKMTFRNIAPYSLAEVDRRFMVVMTVAVGSSGTSVNLYETTRHSHLYLKSTYLRQLNLLQTHSKCSVYGNQFQSRESYQIWNWIIISEVILNWDRLQGTICIVYDDTVIKTFRTTNVFIYCFILQGYSFFWQSSHFSLVRRVWDLRVSSRWKCHLWFSEVWFHVDLQTIIIVSEERIIFILSVEEGLEETFVFVCFVSISKW